MDAANLQLAISRGADVNKAYFPYPRKHGSKYVPAYHLMAPDKYNGDGEAKNETVVLPMLELLLKAGADPDSYDCDCVPATRLMRVAIRYGLAGAVEKLVAHGANVTLNSGRKTMKLLIHEAGYYGSPSSVVRALADKGADVNATSAIDNLTALHYAAAAGSNFNKETVTTLVAVGANLEARSSKGETPLLYVMTSSVPAWNFFNATKLLVDLGSDFQIARNSDGRTGFEQARYRAEGTVSYYQVRFAPLYEYMKKVLGIPA